VRVFRVCIYICICVALEFVFDTGGSVACIVYFFSGSDLI
jgi:hypothetical protein